MSNDILDKILSKLDHMDSEIKEIKSTMATKDDLVKVKNELAEDLTKIHVKLDGITEQVVQNTEQEYLIRELAEKVHEHETDITLIKKILANQ